MKKTLTIVVLVLIPTQAMACHRFHVWRFPEPQRCEVTSHYHLKEQMNKDEDKSWYVEIILTPKVLDEISHGIGIEKIKKLNQPH